MIAQAAIAAEFRFLRRASRPNTPRPPAKSGNAAGKGVATGALCGKNRCRQICIVGVVGIAPNPKRLVGDAWDRTANGVPPNIISTILPKILNGRWLRPSCIIRRSNPKPLIGVGVGQQRGCVVGKYVSAAGYTELPEEGIWVRRAAISSLPRKKAIGAIIISANDMDEVVRVTQGRRSLSFVNRLLCASSINFVAVPASSNAPDA